MTSTAPEARAGGPPHEEELPRMSFGDHLDELRRRLIWSLLAIVLGIVMVVPFKGTVTDIYVEPYHEMWTEAYRNFLDDIDAERAELVARGETPHPTRQRVFEFHDQYRQEILSGRFPEESYGDIYTVGAFRIPRTLKALGGLEDFWVFMAATFLFGLVLALPIVLYQAWAFVAAGLYRHERRVVMRFLPFALFLALIGVAFGYFFVVPTGLFFLTRVMDFGNVEPLFSVQQYFSFLLTLTAALGVVFQLPLLMLAVHKVGIMTHRQMRRNWRYVVLGFFVLAAVVTPPDPFTQVLMAVPMILLYCVGLVLTWRAEAGAGHHEVEA
ncbi:MAG: twin-arginine translocase subunit TatC [Planctomycetes bacterium]|nr:twin-arginine translocase subunit TatC [Planctomycetota bacterium]